MSWTVTADAALPRMVDIPFTKELRKPFTKELRKVGVRHPFPGAQAAAADRRDEQRTSGTGP